VQFRHESEGWRNAGEYKERNPGADIVISQALESRPRLVKVDEASKHETVILDPNPQFEHLRFGKVEVVHWTGKKGEPLTAGLIYPTDFDRRARYPLVIQTYHFLPNRFLLDGPHTTAFAAQELANKGIAVMQLPQSPLLEPSEWTPEYGRVETSQIESAIDYLDGLGVIDRERVGLVGFSKTGHQVIYPLVFSNYHFAAATSAEGADYGFMTYLCAVTAPYSSILDQMYGGPPWNSNWKSWMELSVTFNYDKVHTPLRLESDSNDPRDRGFAGVLDEWETFAALKKLRKPVELIFVPHGAHPVEKPWDRMTSQQGDVDWFVFWLKGEEDPDPVKSEQYVRWRELKRLQQMQFAPQATN
jgi:dipeptidyl aminopeptidase/acylaminoacyl peptidase